MNNQFIPYKPKLTNNARELRKNLTEPEKRLWKNILSKKQLRSHKFLRQKPLGGFIVDFYCPKLILAIEIDGDSHGYQEEYDLKRTEELTKLGILVVRYSNNDIMKNLQGVFDDLDKTVQVREKDMKNVN